MSEKLALQAPVDLYGAFWRPEKPDNVITGRLARDGKFLLLTTSPVYKETLDVRTDFLLGDEHDRIDILHGFTTDGTMFFTVAAIATQGRSDQPASWQVANIPSI